MGHGKFNAMFLVVKCDRPKAPNECSDSDTTKIMWDDLKKRYAMANTPKIHQLKVNIANCKQGDLDVGEFYLKLKKSME